MTALLLIAFFLVAPVAGAEDALYLNCMDLHAKTENEHLCDRFKDYAVDEDKYLISDKHIHQNCINIDGNDVCHKIKPSDSEEWIAKPRGDNEICFKIGEIAKPHVTGPATLVQSESEKWKEKCEEWTEKADNMSWNAEKTMILYSYFCTRYNAALLEEIREKIK